MYTRNSIKIIKNESDEDEIQKSADFDSQINDSNQFSDPESEFSNISRQSSISSSFNGESFEKDSDKNSQMLEKIKYIQKLISNKQEELEKLKMKVSKSSKSMHNDIKFDLEINKSDLNDPDPDIKRDNTDLNLIKTNLNELVPKRYSDHNILADSPSNLSESNSHTKKKSLKLSPIYTITEKNPEYQDLKNVNSSNPKIVVSLSSPREIIDSSPNKPSEETEKNKKDYSKYKKNNTIAISKDIGIYDPKQHTSLKSYITEEDSIIENSEDGSDKETKNIKRRRSDNNMERFNKASDLSFVKKELFLSEFKFNRPRSNIHHYKNYGKILIKKLLKRSEESINKRANLSKNAVKKIISALRQSFFVKNENVGAIKFADCCYKEFSQKYGLKKVSGKKFVDFIASAIKYKKNTECGMFLKDIGTSLGKEYSNAFN